MNFIISVATGLAAGAALAVLAAWGRIRVGVAVAVVMAIALLPAFP